MENEIKQMLDNHGHLQEYLFVRGFLLTDRDDLDLQAFPFYGNWKQQQITDSLYAYTHKWQYVHHITVNGNTFFLLGHAYDPFSMNYEEDKILSHLAEVYTATGDYQDVVDGITGLYVFGAVIDGVLRFQIDPSGMQSGCFGVLQDHFYLSSHPQLIGDLCRLRMDPFVKELTRYKWYYRVMGPYLPADLTPFAQVKRIVPDIEYTYTNQKVTHRRFYPLRNISVCKDQADYDQVIHRAADILKKNMQLVVQKWDKPSISLSGGIDSNTTFAAANGLYDRIGVFSFISAEKETIDADAAQKIAERFQVPWKLYTIPDSADGLEDYDEIVQIIDHNNGYVAKGRDNEYRKRVYLMQNLDTDVEIKSWTSETIRAYWYKHYGRKSFPKLSAKLFRNLYKIFIFDRSLAHKVDQVFAAYIQAFEYDKIPSMYPPADMHYNEVTWGSWGGLNISEMRIYAELTIIYNNRKFLDLLFRVPLDKRISDQHHLDMKKYLNKELYDMHIRVVNMKETDFRAFMLNVIFTINSILPF